MVAQASNIILGFHSRDETALLVYNNSKMSLKFCLIRESNCQKTFAIVVYTNMAAVESRENQEYVQIKIPAPEVNIPKSRTQYYALLDSKERLKVLPILC